MTAEPLPPVPVPMGRYTGATACRGVVYTAGATPRDGKRLVARGRVGEEVTPEAAAGLAGLAARRALAAAAELLGGLNAIDAVVQMTVYIACGAQFCALSPVADGATEALLTALPGSSPPSRAAVGVFRLPDDAPVEVTLVVAARASGGVG